MSEPGEPNRGQDTHRTPSPPRPRDRILIAPSRPPHHPSCRSAATLRTFEGGTEIATCMKLHGVAVRRHFVVPEPVASDHRPIVIDLEIAR